MKKTESGMSLPHWTPGFLLMYTPSSLGKAADDSLHLVGDLKNANQQEHPLVYPVVGPPVNNCE